jgi:hypothetical protein
MTCSTWLVERMTDGGEHLDETRLRHFERLLASRLPRDSQGARQIGKGRRAAAALDRAQQVVGARVEAVEKS